jgi:hypothetical protein
MPYLEAVVKRFFCLFFIFLSGMSLFAQTHYTFVLEKQAADKDIIIPIFQTLASALVTENDFLSIVCYSDNTAYFPLLPGNTPNLIQIAGDYIRSSPLKPENVTDSGISSAINRANEQAKTWGGGGV